jgi:hypothetical protein
MLPAVGGGVNPDRVSLGADFTGLGRHLFMFRFEPLEQWDKDYVAEQSRIGWQSLKGVGNPAKD